MVIRLVSRIQVIITLEILVVMENTRAVGPLNQRGPGRWENTLLTGVVGFYVPGFGFDGHLMLGIVALRASAAQLSRDWEQKS